jgi:hypothetical protein
MSDAPRVETRGHVGRFSEIVGVDLVDLSAATGVTSPAISFRPGPTGERGHGPISGSSGRDAGGGTVRAE